MKFLAPLALAALLGSPAAATPVAWADWTSNTGSTATGTLATVGGPVGVTVSATSGFYFVDLGGGFNFFSSNAPVYSGHGVLDSSPPNSDMIALGSNSTVTINFSQAIDNIYIALVSWNINGIVFSDPVSILEIGCGYWGCGTGTVSNGGLNVDLAGEAHGTLQVLGSHSTFSFTHGDEYWHGFTIGVAGVASPVPVPAALPLMLLALGGLGVAARRRRT